MKLVLVCEHSIFVRHSMVSMLRELGLRPLLASDGREAHAMIRFLQPDLVISEVDLPEINGIDLFKWVRDDPTLPTFPWIMMGLPGAQPVALTAGCPYFLPKPIKSRVLEQVAYQALHREAKCYVRS